MFFGDVASVATLSRAVKDGRILRLARGLYSADLRSDPAEPVARNGWAIIARLMPDALIADRSAAEDGIPTAGVLTVVSHERKEPLELPGLVIAPRPGPGPLADDLAWAEGLRLTSEARTLIDNLAVSRGRGGRLARTLSRAELEDWVVRTSQRRPDGWLASLRTRALEVGEELGVPERRPLVEDIIGAAAGTRAAVSGESGRGGDASCAVTAPGKVRAFCAGKERVSSDRHGPIAISRRAIRVSSVVIGCARGIGVGVDRVRVTMGGRSWR